MSGRAAGSRVDPDTGYAAPMMLVLGIALALLAIFGGAFIHPLLFLLGLAVIIVALVAD